MKFSLFIAGIISIFSIGSMSSAATVQLDVSGTIGFTRDLDNGPIKSGQTVSASFVFDADAPAIAQGSSNIFALSNAKFVYKDLGRTTVFDSAQWSSPFINTISATGALSFGQQFQFISSDDMGSSGALILNLPIAQSVDNSTLKPLASTLMTNGISGLSQTNSSWLGIGFDGSGWWGDCPYPQTNCQFMASIDSLSLTSIQAVPIPATLPLLGLGVLGMGVFGRRRRS